MGDCCDRSVGRHDGECADLWERCYHVEQDKRFATEETVKAQNKIIERLQSDRDAKQERIKTLGRLLSDEHAERHEKGDSRKGLKARVVEARKIILDALGYYRAIVPHPDRCGCNPSENWTELECAIATSFEAFLAGGRK